MQADVLEHHNVLEAHPDIAARLHKEFEILDGQKHDYSGQEVKVDMSDETVKQLKTLGYVE